MAILQTMRAVLGDQVASEAWLDIGCGSGEIAATLSKHVASVVGVDPEGWRRWDDLVASHARLRLLRADCAQLGDVVADGSIGVAVCNQVYEHVADVSGLLVSIHAALKPGGHCYFAGPNLLWPIEPHVHLPFVHWLPRRSTIRLLSALGVRRIVELDAWSTHYWRLKQLFDDSGFDSSSLVAQRFVASRPEFSGLAKTRLFRRAAELLEPLSPGFVFLLTKRSPQ